MAKNNYYAVRKGLVPGIYSTWKECQDNVSGFPSAEFKGFPTREAAEEYMGIKATSVTKETTSPITQSNSGKIYAVKNGRIKGIFFSWKDCEAQVKDFVGAKYKAFSGEDIVKAYDFIQNTEPSLDDCAPKNGCVAYVDGSFNERTNEYGSGVVLIHNNQTETKLSFKGDTPEFLISWNVAGEIVAALKAIKRACAMGYSTIDIYYDYRGIECWFAKLCPDKSEEEQWKANTPIAKHYVNELKQYINKIDIRFHKVAAHTGVKYNEMADALAREAVGL